MNNSTEVTKQIPEKIFYGQWDSERVEIVVRKHWMAYVSTILLMFGLFAFSFFFTYIFAIKLNLTGDEMSVFFLILGIYYLIILSFGMATWVDYYFDIVIVTDQRLISIQQKGLFVRGIDGLSLLRVQNVSAESKGLLQTMFNYGMAYTETAGEQSSEEVRQKIGNFCFDFIPDPYNFSEKVMRLHDALVANSEHIDRMAQGEGDLKSSKEFSQGEVAHPSPTFSSLGEIATGDVNKHETLNIAENDKYPNEPDI